MRKNAFILPADQIYMCGHSLGPLSKLAKHQLDDAIHAWGQDMVKAWNTQVWIDLPQQVAASIAAFLGVDAKDVAVCDSTSVNLFKVLMGALKINSKRQVILTTDDNFPADHYVAQGIQALNKAIIFKSVAREALLDNLTEQVAILMLTHVNYRDANVHQLHALTTQAHQQGILTVWDLSHSVGALPLNLKTSNADFAVGCTYKYLNGGPGAPAFIYAHPKHQHPLISPIYGWMGHEKPFAFEADFKSQGMAQFISGTPYILSLKALEGALKSIEGVNMAEVRQKSLTYSMCLIQGLQALGLDVITPLHDKRGGHVAFLHPQGLALARALIDFGVVVDYRHPGLIRLCVNPLYLTHSDILACVEKLQHILDRHIFKARRYQQALKVT